MLRFVEKFVCHVSFLSLQDLVMDILRVLASPDLEVRRKTLEVALDLVSSRNVEEVLHILEFSIICLHFLNIFLSFLLFLDGFDFEKGGAKDQQRRGAGRQRQVPPAAGAHSPLVQRQVPRHLRYRHPNGML